LTDKFLSIAKVNFYSLRRKQGISVWTKYVAVFLGIVK